MATREREYLHLSSGVDYIEYRYFDDKGNAVERSAATKCLILECDKDGNVLKQLDGRVAKSTTQKIQGGIIGRFKRLKDVLFKSQRK